MKRLCKDSAGFSSSNSRLTVHTPLSFEGQQLTTEVHALIYSSFQETQLQLT